MMTTKYLNTTGIPLYKFKGDTYCKMTDVCSVIHHEINETRDKNLLDALDRMEMRIVKNVMIVPGRIAPEQIQEDKMPHRYAVGYYDYNGDYHFYASSKDGKAIYSKDPKDALRFRNYRDASACADFVEEDASVLDMEGLMTEEERWVRELTMPMPYDADEGNEKAIPVEVMT